MTAWTRSGFCLGAAGSLLLGLQVSKFRLKCEFMGSSPVHLLHLYRGVYTAVMEDEQNKQFFNRRSYRWSPHGCWRLQLLPLSCAALESSCTWTLPRMHSGFNRVPWGLPEEALPFCGSMFSNSSVCSEPALSSVEHPTCLEKAVLSRDHSPGLFWCLLQDLRWIEESLEVPGNDLLSS